MKSLEFDGRTVFDLESALKQIPYTTQANRFIGYNLILGVFKGTVEQWGKDIVAHNEWYQSLVGNYFKGPVDWLSLKDDDFSDINKLGVDDVETLYQIHTDVIRTCTAGLRDFSPGKKRSQKNHRSVERILYIIAEFNEEIGYYQGFDRFAYIFFIMALNFCIELGIDKDYAESMAYFMATSIILLNGFYKHMKSEEDVTQWIKRYQYLLEKARPEVALRLKCLGVHPLQYVFKWSALLFADEHTPDDLFRVWDICLLHKDDFETFVFCACIAHLWQITLSHPGDKGLLELLTNYKSWNMEALIHDTLLFYSHAYEDRAKSTCCVNFQSFFALEIPV